MVFANSQGPIPGIGMAFPDVCLTPVVVPVPIPYPNIAMRPMCIPTQFTTYTMMMPTHNLLTMHPMTNGDNAGVNMGVASGMVMGPSNNLMSSIKVFHSVAPVTRMLDMTGHNGMSPNMIGLSMSPSQPILMVLV